MAIRPISPSEFNALANEQEAKLAPISPEKAPRRLKIIPERRHDSLNQSVRRALFAQDALSQYHDLNERDLRLANERQEQYDDYSQRASEYADQIRECKKMKRKLRSEIKHALKYDRIENSLNTHKLETP